MNTIRASDIGFGTRSIAMRRMVALLAGAMLVAFAAQAAVPVPGTPVPLTFQVPAVLIVGGLLGPRLGAASMVMYLVLGALGLPVFAPGGVPGIARLLGPTGGYLLAFPVAAALVGRLTDGRRLGWLVGGLVLGVVTIHLGGVAQLAVLGGDVRSAVQLGSLPFWLGDIVKLSVAGLIVWRFGSRLRALL